MNTTATPITPIQTAQAPANAGRQQDDDAADAPFSQVLSGEIAQHQRTREAGKGSDGAEAAWASADPAATAESSAPAIVVPETFMFDPQQARSLQPLTETDPAQTATDAAACAASMQPLELLLATAAVAGAPSRGEGAAGPDPAQGIPQAGKGRTPRAAGALQASDPAAVGQKVDSALQAKPTAAAVSATLTANGASDGPKAEFLADLMSHPSMRAAAHAALQGDANAGAASNRLAPQVGTPAWGQALGDKLVWMAAGTQQTASLTLNPPNLGPVQVVLNVSNDQATASFFAAQPEVRQAIEAAFPRLRDMLNEAGIQLGQATVSADTPPRHESADQQAQRSMPTFAGSDDAAPSGLTAVQVPVARSGRGLVDTFA